MKSSPIRQEAMQLHGHSVSYRIGGEGPAILLIHGVTGSSGQWEPAMQLLADHYTVIAPDLLGHGLSAKPRGDYSLGAYASGVRDLTVALGITSATVVGHSLGGGIALQFAYQFPERVDRLVLVSSGGLGRDVHMLLRAATLPGSEFVLPLISNERVLGAGAAVSGFLGKFGLRAGPDIAEFARGYATLADGDSRRAFLHTLRAVIDPSGQRVDATDRLYLAEDVPSLIVWGGAIRSSRSGTPAPPSAACPAAGSRSSTMRVTSRSWTSPPASRGPSRTSSRPPSRPRRTRI